MSKIKKLNSNSRWSEVVISDNRIETSGIVAKDASQDITLQTKCVLNQLEQFLNDAGADKSQLTRIQIWLNSIHDLDAMNVVYDEWVSDIEKPARACVGSQLASTYLLEIQATAFLN